MKHVFIALILLTSSLMVAAQKTAWKQMEDFHGVMSKSFHPAETGNLQPLKENVDSLVLRAKAWQSSPIPAGYETKPLKPVLVKLVAECNAVKTAIMQKKNDVALKELITTAHETFHQVMEICND